MKDESIVCFAADWEGDLTSKHQVMRVLSRSNKILWVNSIGMRSPTVSAADFSRAWKKVVGWFKGLTKVNENLYHFTPIVLPLPSFKIARLINKKLLCFSVKYFRKKLHMKDVLLWLFPPNAVELVGSLGERFVLYYCVDEWSKFSFIDSQAMREMEIELIGKSDLVITTAEHLQKDKVQFNPNTHLIPHGVDYDYFSKAVDDTVPIAEDIRPIKRPILGFFGLIHEWIDLGLLEKVAQAHPDWSIVLIGKVSVDTGRLKNYDNVYFLGQKPYDSLIHYCRSFDIGLIPFHLNELTLNVNPIKLREYLAAGIPVVSTPLPEVTKYKDIVSIGHTAEEFIKEIETTLETEDAEKRRLRGQQMKTESWEGKVSTISQLIADTERQKAIGASR